MTLGPLSVPVTPGGPRALERLLGKASTRCNSRRAEVLVTEGGLYVVIENGPAWGVDLNALAADLIAAVENS